MASDHPTVYSSIRPRPTLLASIHGLGPSYSICEYPASAHPTCEYPWPRTILQYMRVSGLGPPYLYLRVSVASDHPTVYASIRPRPTLLASIRGLGPSYSICDYPASAHPTCEHPYYHPTRVKMLSLGSPYLQVSVLGSLYSPPCREYRHTLLANIQPRTILYASIWPRPTLLVER